MVFSIVSIYRIWFCSVELRGFGSFWMKPKAHRDVENRGVDPRSDHDFRFEKKILRYLPRHEFIAIWRFAAVPRAPVPSRTNRPWRLGSDRRLVFAARGNAGCLQDRQGIGTLVVEME